MVRQARELQVSLSIFKGLRSNEQLEEAGFRNLVIHLGRESQYFWVQRLTGRLIWDDK